MRTVAKQLFKHTGFIVTKRFVSVDKMHKMGINLLNFS